MVCVMKGLCLNGESRLNQIVVYGNAYRSIFLCGKYSPVSEIVFNCGVLIWFFIWFNMTLLVYVKNSHMTLLVYVKNSHMTLLVYVKNSQHNNHTLILSLVIWF